MKQIWDFDDRPLNPVIPKIWLLIVLSLLYISMQISNKNLVLDQDNFHLISLNILMTCLLDNV